MTPEEGEKKHREHAFILDALNPLCMWDVDILKLLYMRKQWYRFATEQKELETFGHVRLGSHANA
jgi:hypothetical protein